MTQKKAFEVDRWLARPDPAMRIVLLYGPDRGLVSERARLFAEKTGLPLDDPFSVVRLDAAELDLEPGRLEGEARTVPMFSAARLIWVGNAGAHKALAADVKRLAETPSADSIILIEAGDLKKGAALRTSIEQAAAAVALPCYADDARAVDGLIDEELGKAGLSISLEARQALKASLGGDRLASRGEIAKLVLYCLGKGKIELDDIRALTGDVSAVTSDDAVDALLVGRPAELDSAFSRRIAAGAQNFVLLSAAMRQFQLLQLMREKMDREGSTPAAAVAGARPPVFFSRRATVEEALRRWSGEAIGRALARLQDAVLASRKRPELSEAIARQAMLALALEAWRRPGNIRS